MKRSPLVFSRWALLCAAGVLGWATLTPAPAALAQDEPAQASPIPEPDLITSAWTLKFTHSQPATISIENSDGSIQWYWYFTYKVVNKGSEDQLFNPEIVIADDQGNITRANRGVDVRVFRAIRDLLRNPLLMSPAEIPGRMFPGEDFAREGVAIWPVPAQDVDEFVVFFGGIYGEVKPVLDPVTGEPVEVPMIDPRTGEPKKDADGNPRMMPLEVRRTRKIHYKSPGTNEAPQRMRADLVDESDVMR